jgi:signal transduction histidine kinase
MVLPISELKSQTRQWLSGPSIQQVMVLALRTEPEVMASGVLILADHPNRRWSELDLEVFATLIQQLVQIHRSMHTSQRLQEQYQKLEMVNWYKHRRLEELYRNLVGASNHLIDLSTQLPASLATLAAPSLKHIRNSLTELPHLIKRESWRLRYGSDTGVLVSLLKRSIDRVEGLVKQNQLRIQVHNQEPMSLTGDIGKIDLVLYEMILAACHRLSIGGKIDIWCQCIDNTWAEISMTDNGEIDLELLVELNQEASPDWLAANRQLQRAPGRHLRVCQQLSLQLQGRLDLYKLEDGRTLTRLVLPLQAV